MRVALFALVFFSLALAHTPDMAAKNHATYYKKKLPFICTPTLTLNDILNVGDTLTTDTPSNTQESKRSKGLKKKSFWNLSRL